MLSDFNQQNGQNGFAVNLGGKISVTIEKLTVMKLQDQTQQYMRPYQTTMTGPIENQLAGLVGNFKDEIPVTAISNTVAGFILPSAAPEFKNVMRGGMQHRQNLGIEIDGGWAERRFAFTMMVKCCSNNMETRELVTGYTDRLDGIYRDVLQQDFVIAPETIFYINSISLIDTRQIGGFAVPMMVDSVSVLGGGLGSNHYDATSPWKMTPMVLLDNTRMLNETGGMSSFPNELQQNSTDHRAISNVPTLTSRFNNSATHYFGKIVNSYRQTVNGFNSRGQHYDANSIVNQLRGSMVDPGLMSYGFTTFLAMSLRTHTNNFTMNDLNKIDPNLDSKTFVHDVPLRSSGFGGAEWHASDLETQMALVIANSVTNLCLKYSLADLAFESTNNVLGGQPFTSIASMHALANGLNVQGSINQVEQTINSELIPIVSRSNQIGYWVKVHYVSGFEIEISIGFNGQSPYVYNFPSFCDALLSPMLTTDTNLLRRNSYDINTVINEVDENMKMQQFNHGNGGQMAQQPFGNVNQNIGWNPVGNDGLVQMETPVQQPQNNFGSSWSN